MPKETCGGNESLFESRDVHNAWNCSVCHQVLRLSFGGGDLKEPVYVEANLIE